MREHAQQAVEHARADRLKTELCELEGARDVHLQPEVTGGVQRALRSELLRREVDEAIARAVVLTAVGKRVPLGRGWTRSLQRSGRG